MKTPIDKQIIAELKRKLGEGIGDPEKVRQALRNFGVTVDSEIKD